MEEKKTIKLRLYTAVVLIVIGILLLIYIVMFSINRLKSKNKEISNLGYINTTTEENSEEVKKEIKKEITKDIEIVTSLEDEITANSAWCGTFQLVWNDMMNNVVKQDVVFTPQLKMVENLNKQTFKETELSEKDYYKVYDLFTLELKEKIEKAIEEKFNEKSDILDVINWTDVPKDSSGYTDNYKKYLFYAMLKKEFNFENDFNELEKDTFGTKYKDIKYFGINKDSDSKLYSQVQVLYYNSETDFAIILNTKENEQVILARGAKGNNFESIYNNIVKNASNYKENKKFTENDYLKVPNIKFDILKSFDELCYKQFFAKDGAKCKIEQAFQTIKVEMDKSGGKIKSEAAIVMEYLADSIGDEPSVEYRYFYLNDEFAMFLKEKDKKLPYFAANIENITLFQE